MSLNLSIDPGDKRVGTETRPNPTLPAKNFQDLSRVQFIPLLSILRCFYRPSIVHNFSQTPLRDGWAYVEIIQRKSISSIKWKTKEKKKGEKLPSPSFILLQKLPTFPLLTSFEVDRNDRRI